MEEIKDAFNKYSDFSGRTTRKQFWMFFLFQVIFAIITMVIPILSLLYLGLIIPVLSITARRLHDVGVGYSGWWQLISLSGIGYFIILIFCILPSGPHNAHGANLYE